MLFAVSMKLGSEVCHVRTKTTLGHDLHLRKRPGDFLGGLCLASASCLQGTVCRLVILVVFLGLICPSGPTGP